MKTTICLLLFWFFVMYTEVCPAQEEAILTTVLTNVLTMNVNSAPVFTFGSASDYLNGTDANGAGNIMVSSNFNFDIDLSAEGDHLIDPVSLQSIPVSDFKVDAIGDGGISITSKPLSTSQVKIVDEGAAGVAKLINLAYSAKAGGRFLNKPSGSYIQTLLFTITVD